MQNNRWQAVCALLVMALSAAAWGQAAAPAGVPAMSPRAVPPGMAATAPATMPATPGTMPAAPASQPAVADDSPKGAMLRMVHGLIGGDDKLVMGSLAFSDEKDREIAASMFGNMIAEQKLQKAMSVAFDKAAGDDPSDIADAEKMVNDATVKEDGDHAELTTAGMGGPKWFAIKKDGKWMIDFEKTQDSMGGMPTKAEQQTAATETKVLVDMAADVAAKKFKTPEEAMTEMDKRMTAAHDVMAGTVPATGPSTMPMTAPATMPMMDPPATKP